MLKVKKGSTKSISEIDKVINEVSMEKISFIMYFVSSRLDFKEITEKINNRYPGVINFGGTSHGEIVEEKGFDEGYFNIMAVYGDDFEVSPIVLTNIKEKAMAYKRRITRAISNLGLDINDKKIGEKMFAISLIDYLPCCEESVMALMERLFKGKELQLAGGSCGQFGNKKCYLGLNGRVIEGGAILAFVKTKRKFKVYRNMAYERIGNSHIVNSANLGSRIVSHADGEVMANLYSKELNVVKSELNAKLFSQNPIGVVVGDELGIASPVECKANGDICFYTRVIPGNTFYFMKPKDVMIAVNEDLEKIKKEIGKVGLIIGFNCILRYMRSKEERNSEEIYNKINSVGPFFGFTTLGEQIGTKHVNQTLLMLAIEDK